MAGSTRRNESHYTVTIGNTLNKVIVSHLRHSLASFNRVHAGHDRHKGLLIVLRTANKRIIGGLVGGTYFGYLHIDVLWVDQHQRRRGHGERLLNTAEQEAVRRGCRYAHLDTHGFQALDFYKKRGYKVVGELKDLPPGDSRYLLRKVLKS